MPDDQGMQRKRFEEWMRRVNGIMVKRCGMGSEDLPDCDYWNWWHDGVSPSEAAQDAIAAARSGW